MVERRTTRQQIRQLQKVATWQLVVLLILASFVSATLLRMNNTNMVARRNAVASADKAGNLTDISNRIYDLQTYSATHMNASTGTFYLQEQYNRDTQAAMDSAGVGSANAEDSPQARAFAICNPHLQYHGYTQSYQDCMIAELSKAGQVVDPAKIKTPNPALYRYDFISPLWSPDFAGLAVLVSIIIALVIVTRLVTLAILQLLVKRHYKEA